MAKFEIWQTKDRERMFTPSRLLSRFGMKPGDGNYTKIYEGEIDDGDGNVDHQLERLFQKFNVGAKPEGYKGHSLSVSDVVVYNGKKYFTDSYGFKKLRSFKSRATTNG